MFDMKYVNLIVRRMSFYQENCNFKIFQVGTLRGVYYVQFEHSITGQNNSIRVCIKEYYYSCGLCKRQVPNLGFIEVTSLV